MRERKREVKQRHQCNKSLTVLQRAFNRTVGISVLVGEIERERKRDDIYIEREMLQRQI